VSFGAEFTVANTLITTLASAVIATIVNTISVQLLNNKNKYVRGLGFFMSFLFLVMYYLMLLIQTAFKSSKNPDIVNVWAG
jgi:ABC-type sugar transport system permease subunit